MTANFAMNGIFIAIFSTIKIIFEGLTMIDPIKGNNLPQNPSFSALTQKPQGQTVAADSFRVNDRGNKGMLETDYVRIHNGLEGLYSHCPGKFGELMDIVEVNDWKSATNYNELKFELDEKLSFLFDGVTKGGIEFEWLFGRTYPYKLVFDSKYPQNCASPQKVFLEKLSNVFGDLSKEERAIPAFETVIIQGAVDRMKRGYSRQIDLNHDFFLDKISETVVEYFWESDDTDSQVIRQIQVWQLYRHYTPAQKAIFDRYDFMINDLASQQPPSRSYPYKRGVWRMEEVMSRVKDQELRDFRVLAGAQSSGKIQLEWDADTPRYPALLTFKKEDQMDKKEIDSINRAWEILGHLVEN